MSILLAVVVLALLTVAGATVYVGRAVLSHRIDRSVPGPDSTATEDLQLFTATLRTDVDRLTLAVSEGIARVDRAENRIQKTVTSARRLVREAGLEHAGIEAEHAELRSPDDEGIEPLPAMPAPVDATRTVRIPGGILTLEA